MTNTGRDGQDKHSRTGTASDTDKREKEDGDRTDGEPPQFYRSYNQFQQEQDREPIQAQEREQDQRQEQEQQQDQQQTAPWDFDIPDPTTLHNTSADAGPTAKSNAASTSNTAGLGPPKYPYKEVAYYDCPFCEFHDPVERTVRSHITEMDADDPAHPNRNAFSGFVFVQAMAADETIVKDVPSPGMQDRDTDTSMDTETRTDTRTDTAPETETETDTDTRPTMTLTTDTDRETDADADTKTEMVPDEEESIPSKSDPRIGSTGFFDLTDKQRRVILARLDDRDAGRSLHDIAEAAGVSKSYPSHILANNESMIETLGAELEAGSLSFERLLDQADLDEPEALTLTSIEDEGEVASKTDVEPEPEPESEPEVESVPEPDFELETQPEPEPDIEPEAETEAEAVEMEAETDADAEAETEAETGMERGMEASESQELIDELASVMTVLENDALTEAETAPPDSPAYFAAQKQLYVISLVQNWLEEVDPDPTPQPTWAGNPAD